MAQDRQLGTGLFAGVDEAICSVLGLEDKKQLKQRTTYRKVACRRVPPDVLVDLVRLLYGLVSTNLANLGGHKPSPKNWRWEPKFIIADCNDSSEVVLERAIALLAKREPLAEKRGPLAEWSNQIPAASGLVDPRLDKRAAVDLARIVKDRLDLYELKWKSDTPIYAAFEILRYGLAYLLYRVNRANFGCADLDTMKVSALGLNVLAPLRYYERKHIDLTWLQAGLDAGIRTVSQEQVRLGFIASFQFLELPKELSVEPKGLFACGAEAKAACGATPLAPKAKALVHAMSNLAPVWPAPDSV